MSYCRMGPDSDVYVIESGDEDGDPCWVCFCTTPVFQTGGRITMLSHLAAHALKGDQVPHSAVLRLWKEILDEEFPYEQD